MAMVKSGRINRLVISLIPLIVVAALLFPNSFGASQVPAQERYQFYLPLLSFTPQDVYYDYLNSIGGSDTLFYVADQLAFLGRGHQLVILDVSAPSHPVLLTSVNLPAPPQFLVVRDGYGFLALGDVGFGVLDLRQPAQAYLLYRLPLDGFSRHVLLSDQQAFVSSKTALYVLDISQPASPQILSSIQTSAYTSQFHDSLLLVEYFDGFTFFDIRDLNNIVEVSYYFGPSGSLVAVTADHIYLQCIACGIYSCAYWLDIVDISDPYTPFKSSTYNSMNEFTQIIIQGDTAYIGDGRNVIVAHITPDGGFDELGYYPFGTYIEFLQFDRGKLYLGGNNSIEILDVNDPVNIIQVGKYTSPTYAIKSSQTRLPFIYTQVKLIDSLSDAVSMLVFDVSDPKLLRLANDVAYSSLNIQPVFLPNQIYLDGERMYVTFPTGGGDFFPIEGIRIFDLQQPVVPIELADYLPEDPEGGAGVWVESLHNSVEIRDSIGYIVTLGNNLLIVDLSDPLSPVVLSKYSAYARTVRVDGNHAYLISREYEDPNISLHLLILDVSDLTNPILMSDYVYASFPDAYDASFDVREGIAYLGLPGALRLLDVSDPTNPAELSELPLDSESYPSSIKVEAGLAVIGIDNRVEVIDVSTPLTPIWLSDIELTYQIRSIEIHDPYVFLVGYKGAYVLDIAQPEQPRLFLHYPGYATSIARKSNYLVYLARYSDGLEIYRFYPPGFSVE
jgi:hypothetical protein